MTSTSQNGWVCLPSDSPKLHTWVIPARTGEFRLRLRNGSAGFILAHLALWIAETVEPVRGAVTDDWGYANRLIRGSETIQSNHASGTAMDINAMVHPLGQRGTWTPAQVRQVKRRLDWWAMGGTVRWGETYSGRIDPMHFEINQPLARCERVAKRLVRLTPRGKRIVRANPGQRAVIWS